MQQLYPAIQERSAEVICVLREEKSGVEGVAKVREKTGAAFPILLDLDRQKTPRYSEGTAFHTYIVGKDGRIAAVLKGEKGKRPTGEEILAALGQLEKRPGPAE